jgi:hypothetical protein
MQTPVLKVVKSTREVGMLGSIVGALWLMFHGVVSPALAQTTPTWREGTIQGQAVSREVREIYEKGLEWMIANQSENGDWQSANNPGPGATGLCLMAFLAYGEDPNFGIHQQPIQRGLQALIRDQDPRTGYLGGSMYHHGFATLALAEAYGAVDERNFWTDSKVPEAQRRSLGEALELAVRTSITSQDKNSTGGWRYAPNSSDADTSVSGAILVSLLAARNAGIEVPDKNIDRAISYFTSMTSKSGQVAYAGGLGGYDESQARISIATLVYAIAGRKDLKEFKACATFLKAKDAIKVGDHYGEYTAYYKAQALFQADSEAWEKWNKVLIKELKQTQKADGHFDGSFGPSVATSMSLLSLALNFRFLPIYER